MNMDTLIQQLAGPVGNMVALIIVVGMFLKFQTSERNKNEAEAVERRKWMSDMASECHRTQTENTTQMTDALTECAKSHESNTVMLARLRDTLERFDNNKTNQERQRV